MNNFTIRTVLTACVMLCTVVLCHGQEMYQYLLKENFHAQQTGAPDLLQIPNNQAQTGEFTVRQVPASTCGQQGNAPGYFFADDAGLVFYNPTGFIGQEYTIAFNFQFDEFIPPPDWVRLLSFTHYDDVGLYIQITDAPNYGTLEFWPFGTVGTFDYFNTTDFYQLILVRNATGMITVYVNGSEFATYDDSETNAYVPQTPDNFIVWFRDDPSALANEASPGFVSDVRIGNYSWTLEQVQTAWAGFCSSLLGIGQGKETHAGLVYPNPAGDKIRLNLPAGGPYEVVIFDITGQPVVKPRNSTGTAIVDVSGLPPGIYVVKVTGKDVQRTGKFVKE